MELLARVGKSLIIGCLAGLAVALFTNFFFKPLIDRLENQTYDMRYSWEFGESFNRGEGSEQPPDYGIHIVDIDDRSLQKLGVYWNWDRSYHARLIRSLSSNSPAAIVFDILFYDPEDHNHAQRLDKLLRQSSRMDPDIVLSEQLRSSIISTINYDRQFIEAAEASERVFFGVRMSNKSDYTDFALSQIENKMTMQWHRSLCPSSAITFSPQTRKEVVTVRNTKPVVDGLFPRLAASARDIGYVNMVPDKDGTIRKVPMFFAFGSDGPIYLPLSVRTVATLFATPNDEIVLEPGRFLDIGKPFKAFKDKQGALSYSYPTVTPAQVEAILEHSEDILSLRPGEQLEISSLVKVGRDEDGGKLIDMYCGPFPPQVVEALLEASMDDVLALKAGEETHVSSEVAVRRDSEIDWVITAPWGYEEWWMSTLDISTLSRVRAKDFDGLAPRQLKLLFHTFSIRNREGTLVSTIPVLRGRALRELCGAGRTALESLAPGTRMDFGRGLRIPLTKSNEHIITYFGPEGVPFPYFSYYDIMNERVQGSLEGRVFIVGSTVPDLFDIKPVPHDDNYPAVEIHASLMNSFLTDTFVTRLKDWENFLILILVAITVGFVAFILKPLPGALLSVLSVFLYFIAAMTLFGTCHIWIEIARPVLTILLTYTGVMAYRYVTEEKDRKFLQNTFKAYLSPELIDIMYKQKQTPKLGGEEGVRTAYFTDIQSFSTFSEKLGSPTRLVELLNEYLTAMTDTLLSHYGTLDKYEGDAIIAFFGAPMPMEDHAYQACLTALDMQAKLGELRKKWVAEGDKWPKIVHEMRMRIGINTGAITTGNMGSAVRMNYTMMGDAVNLAARLESAAKQYGIYTMISDFTCSMIRDDFEVRQLDKIMVVGKSEPVVVYELMARKGELAPEAAKMVRLYSQGLEYFYAREWDKAISMMKQSEAMEPYRSAAPKNMSPSTRIINYCETYKSDPPAPDWDGTSRLTSK